MALSRRAQILDWYMRIGATLNTFGDDDERELVQQQGEEVLIAELWRGSRMREAVNRPLAEALLLAQTGAVRRD